MALRPVVYNTETQRDELAPEGSSGGVVSKAVVTSSQTSNTTVLGNISQLVLPMAANSLYEIACYVTFTAASSTTGLTLGIAVPGGSVTYVEIVVPTGASSEVKATLPRSDTFEGGSITGTASTGFALLTGRITGHIRTGPTAGNCQIRFASEVNGSNVNVAPNSFLVLNKLD